MQLGKFSDYGLRILVQVHTNAPTKTSVGDIALAFGLSDHHLAKIASKLVKGGFLTSTRGRSGGLALAYAADDIRLGAVMRCLTEDTALVECFAGGTCECRIQSSCGLRQPLFEAQQAFFESLDRYTLEQVCSPHQVMLTQLLSPS